MGFITDSKILFVANFSKKCSVCSEEFWDIMSFMTHIKDAHGDFLSDEFSCKPSELEPEAAGILPQALP